MFDKDARPHQQTQNLFDAVASENKRAGAYVS
jgi:hypothetical protein